VEIKDLAMPPQKFNIYGLLLAMSCTFAFTNAAYLGAIILCVRDIDEVTICLLNSEIL
jgi:hypothetical protein